MSPQRGRSRRPLKEEEDAYVEVGVELRFVSRLKSELKTEKGSSMRYRSKVGNEESNVRHMAEYCNNFFTDFDLETQNFIDNVVENARLGHTIVSKKKLRLHDLYIQCKAIEEQAEVLNQNKVEPPKVKRKKAVKQRVASDRQILLHFLMLEYQQGDALSKLYVGLLARTVIDQAPNLIDTRLDNDGLHVEELLWQCGVRNYRPNRHKEAVRKWHPLTSGKI